MPARALDRAARRGDVELVELRSDASLAGTSIAVLSLGDIVYIQGGRADGLSAGTVLVAEELYPRHFKSEYERMGVYLAHCDATSPYDIISTSPIRSLEDMRGMRIRVTGGLTAEIFRVLGAVPTVMAAAEVYPAFQRGIVDAVALGAPDIVVYRLLEVGNYFTKVGVNVTVLQHCFRRAAWSAAGAGVAAGQHGPDQSHRPVG
ncbi:MAG: TRAP transporter substrate-binding protein DctP [Proteobacteria bacterium]|nr:TRAP transporter substrate-binding protein DctP [Pseudomonadota bacterium]